MAPGTIRWNLSDSIALVVNELEPLGQGACSTVYSGHLDSTKVAVKRPAPGPDGTRIQGISEVEILSQLSHGNILKFFGTRTNPLGTADIVLELAEGVTLARALFQRRNLTDSWKRLTIYQISDGLAYLHERNIIHLDLKPPNILFRDRELQQPLIADFGMARKAAVSYRAGARKFRAPDHPRYTRESDVFSLASIACCILSERNPSDEDETRAIVSRVLNSTSYDAIQLTALSGGVQRNPSLRPTAARFRDAFDKPPHRLEIPSMEIAYQADDNAPNPCRWVAFVALIVVICLILAALFTRMFSSK